METENDNLWSLGSVDQDELERSLIDKANSELLERENELDRKRLEKTRKRRSELESKVSILNRKVQNPQSLISQKESARRELEHITTGELAQLKQDEKDIRGRVAHRSKTGTPNIKPEDDESRHSFLVRTGKITPFAKPGETEIKTEEGEEDEEDDEQDDHRMLTKPAQQFDNNIDTIADEEVGDEDLEADVFEVPAASSIKTRDDGIFAEYRYRLRNWEKLRSRNRHQIPADMVLDADAGFKVPGDIWKRLFGYQRTGVRWLWELYSQKAGGIIGDEMGLGKTVQVAAFIASLHYSGMLKKPVLIVCPATVLDQWVDELHQWWPPLRVAILHSIGTAMGAQTPKTNEWDDDEGELDSEYSDVEVNDETLSKSRIGARNLINSIFETGHVILTTYAGIKIYERFIVPKIWGYCCLDEGHKIRNPDSEVSLACKQVKTPYRLILSGTPIQNNLIELWSLFDFIFPGRLGTLPVFQAQFSVPINVGGYANATNIQVQTAYKCAVVLRDMIAPYMLRRMKNDVASDLPAKTEKVLFCKLTKPQKQAYLQFLKSDEFGSIMKGRRQVLYGVDILRKICNHPDLILRDVKKRDYGDPFKSGKMQVVGALLQLWTSQKHRTLLFSQTRQMLDILERYVRDMNIKYCRMDGSTAISQRQQLVSEFNENTSYEVFLLTTKVGGLGVNLTGANRVIIYDPDWNPSTDVQARERAWRLGQKKEVMIYRLMIAGSIEEKIYQRQIFKQFLTNKILKDPKQRRFFKNTDLHDLFSLGDGSESAGIFNGNDMAPPAARPASSSSLPDSKRRKTDASRDRKDTNDDDLSRLTGVSRESDFQTAADNDDAQKNGDGSAASKQEDNILEGIFAKAGVQSTLEHDAVINASRPDTVLMEREAERVASQAADALRESRKETRRAKIGTPTWTGKSGLAGKLRAKRRNPDGGANGDANDDSQRESSTPSSRILQNLRQKKELESKSKSTQSLGSRELNKHARMLTRIKNYLQEQPNKEASSADIISACHISIDSPQEISNLRQMLRKVAVWQDKKWKILDSAGDEE